MDQRLDKSGSGLSKIPSIEKSKEMRTPALDFRSRSTLYHSSTDATLFSSSVPVLSNEKMCISDPENGRESVDDAAVSLNKLQQDVEGNDSLEDVVNHAVGFVLPDDEDELFADLANDYDFTGMLTQHDELDENDLFTNVGGMELDNDVKENLSMGMSKMNLSDGVIGNGVIHYGASNGVGTVAGEHPFGEHPSRTLFVRNINSNVEDSELRSLFEQYGDIRSLYAQCKHRGFVMISYYDIRDARTAMRALQNKPLRRRKLDIHFSIPKDNPSEKDINQGTLVVFNLDPSVSNEDLLQIFGSYGEVKEIRETPNKKHHKFIEFYDVRDADAALRALNRIDIAGKRIKLEPSRPGGTRRSWMLQLNQELEHDDPLFQLHVGSPITNSPPGNWVQVNSTIEQSPMHTFSRSPGFRTTSSTTGSPLPGLTSILHSQSPNSIKLAPIGKDHGRGSHVGPVSSSNLEQRSSLLSSFGASTSNGSTIEMLSGPQFLWGSPDSYSDQAKTNAWARPSLGHPSNGQRPGFPFSARPGTYVGSSQHHHHHVGSAPSGVHLDRHFGFFSESPDTSFIHQAAFGGMNVGPSNGSYPITVGPRAAAHTGIAGNMSENGSPSFRMMSSPRFSPVFLGNGLYPGLNLNNLESERIYSRRIENSSNQVDSKKLFQLDLEKIASGEDTRTTLMIKNIPNKYTSKMLLAAIDENHKGTYDFVYLPIDFKNKCNVGYAFINMLSPSHIIPFYKAFNGKKWEKFNSEKVALLAYARIQGRTALVAHFQNSSLMNEDKRCQPILFHSEGIESGEQTIKDHLPSSSLNVQMHQPHGSEFDNDSEDKPGIDL